MALTDHEILAALAAGPFGGRSDFDLNPGDPRRSGAVRLREAAVLCGLVPRKDGLNVVLTRRAAHLRHHAGQISFPGGKVEAGDAGPADAALREAEEEIGLAPERVRVIGTLDPYVTVTAFRVTPFVGIVEPDWEPVLDPNEVDMIFEVPLDFLMDPRNCHRRHHERDGMRRYYYAMPWQEHFIWGATAGMLKNLADRVAAVRGGAAA